MSLERISKWPDEHFRQALGTGNADPQPQASPSGRVQGDVAREGAGIQLLALHSDYQRHQGASKPVYGPQDVQDSNIVSVSVPSPPAASEVAEPEGKVSGSTGPGRV